MTHTIGRFIVEQPGGPDAMRWVQEPAAPLQPGEVRVRNEAIGVDFIDTQIRGGLLPATLPTGLGFAGVGIAQEVGAGVDHVKPGQKVAYMYFSAGSYATERVVPGERVVALPDQQLAPDVAAGALFRGLTAWYLTQRLRKLGPGHVALVHAAAGGVGLILVQWLLLMGVTVVATVGKAGKADVVRAQGCRHVAVLVQDDFVAMVREVSGGRGADVVYDCVGRDTFAGSLASTRRFGLLVSFGWPSGDPEVSLMAARAQGSIFLTRPTVTHYTAEADDLREGVRALFSLVQAGKLNIRVEDRYPLREAPRAHADLAAGRTTGSVILLP
jgi:NADPH2:quinone reductase